MTTHTVTPPTLTWEGIPPSHYELELLPHRCDHCARQWLHSQLTLVYVAPTRPDVRMTKPLIGHDAGFTLNTDLPLFTRERKPTIVPRCHGCVALAPTPLNYRRVSGPPRWRPEPSHSNLVAEDAEAAGHAGSGKCWCGYTHEKKAISRKTGVKAKSFADALRGLIVDDTE